MKMDKSMSDSEVNDYVYKKLMGDLDPIEASSVFAPNDEPSADPHDGVTISAHGVNVNIKPMNGEQTKEQPKMEDAPEDDEDLSVLGK